MSTEPSSPFQSADRDLYPLRLPHYEVRGGTILRLKKRMSRSREAAALLAQCDGATPARSLCPDGKLLDHLYRRGMLLALPRPLGAPAAPPGEAPSRPTIVFSPHPDDAALSPGGFLCSGRFGPIQIVTFFSRSVHSLLGPGEAAATRVREMEERCYAEALGAAVTLLDLPEALLRGKRTAFELIFWEDGEAEEQMRSEIGAALDELPLDLETADLFIPLGVGNHIDHVLVRDAVLRLLPARRKRLDGVWFYEELPYAAVFPDRSRVLGALSALGTDFKPRLVDVTRSIGEKLELLRIYQSQLPPSEIARTLSYAARLKPDPAEGQPTFHERYWAAAES
jgi:LmbE family N-acetylglucosaminyl deacetylase